MKTTSSSSAKPLVPMRRSSAPRGRVLESGMPRFFRRLAEGVFDQQDLLLRTGELATFINASVTQYELDASSILAVGFSNGANIAASLMLRQPAVLAGAVLLRAMVPFVPEPPLPELLGRPVLIANGTMDGMIPQAITHDLARIFEASGDIGQPPLESGRPQPHAGGRCRGAAVAERSRRRVNHAHGRRADCPRWICCKLARPHRLSFSLADD